MNSKKIAALLLVALVAGVYLITPVAAIDYGTISGTFKTSNTAPKVVEIYNFPGTVNPTPDGVSSFTVNIRVSDTDGNGDIAKVGASLWSMDDGWEADNVQATSGWSVLDANTISLVMTLHFSYYIWPGSYAITVTATDLAGAKGTLDSSAITYPSAIGLTIDGPNALNFGTLTLGSISAAQTSTIHNSANTVIFVRGTAPDWGSSGGGSAVPASTLTADGIAMNSGTSIVRLSNGENPSDTSRQHLTSFVETVPSASITLSGTYTTTIKLTASNS